MRRHTPIRLSQRARTELDDALDPHSLTSTLCTSLERHLTDYANLLRVTGADVKRWRFQHEQKIVAARRLVALLEYESRCNEVLGRSYTLLYGLLQRSLPEWEQHTPAGRPAHRPQDWDRRVLLWRVLTALDRAHVRESYHRDGPRVRFLRVVLKLADMIDGRRPGRGSLRLIQDVCRHRRQRATWTGRTLLFLRYERPLLWPAAK